MTKPYVDTFDDHTARFVIWTALADEIRRDFAHKPRYSLLDIGCSHGGFLQVCRKQLGAGLKLCGADVGKHGLKEFDYISVEELSQADSTRFDVVTSCEVLPYVELQPHAAMVRRLCGDGGLYYAVTGVHSDSAVGSALAADLRLAEVQVTLRSLDEIIQTFEGVGFTVYVKRLNYESAFGFNLCGPSKPVRKKPLLDFLYEDKLVVKCVPSSMDIAPDLGGLQ